LLLIIETLPWWMNDSLIKPAGLPVDSWSLLPCTLLSREARSVTHSARNRPVTRPWRGDAWRGQTAAEPLTMLQSMDFLERDAE